MRSYRPCDVWSKSVGVVARTLNFTAASNLCFGTVDVAFSVKYMIVNDEIGRLMCVLYCNSRNIRCNVIFRNNLTLKNRGKGTPKNKPEPSEQIQTAIDPV